MARGTLWTQNRGAFYLQEDTKIQNPGVLGPQEIQASWASALKLNLELTGTVGGAERNRRPKFFSDSSGGEPHP